MTCTWREDQDGVWETECKELHIFEVGDPTENKAQFCSYCGGWLVPVAYRILEEAE